MLNSLIKGATRGISQIVNKIEDESKNNTKNESPFSERLNDITNRIMNREEFSYNLDEDAFYQQYKDKFTKQADLAMEDAIGKASAMTGGYGNSYAQSVGQQQYYSEMQNLNDIIPELYQLAYDRYNQEGQDLYNQYAMLAKQDDRSYSRGRDAIEDARYEDEKSYSRGRDAIEDERWERQWAIAEDSTYSYSGTTASGKEYNNGSLTNGEIKSLQAALGLPADGYYGEEEKNAAEGLSAQEAYSKFVENPPLVNPQPEESAADYADWDYSEWEGYFATIRNTEGKEAAEEELRRMTEAGFIPSEFTAAAGIGARGSFGH